MKAATARNTPSDTDQGDSSVSWEQVEFAVPFPIRSSPSSIGAASSIVREEEAEEEERRPTAERSTNSERS